MIRFSLTPFFARRKLDCQLQVLAPKYDPLQQDKFRTEVTIGKLYLFMGRALLPLLEAPAGIT